MNDTDYTDDIMDYSNSLDDINETFVSEEDVVVAEPAPKVETIRDRFPDREFVDSSYLMDPKTDELLFSGHDLREGMVVLIEDHMSLWGVEYPVTAHNLRRIFENTQWCKVGRVKFDLNHDLVHFIAIYPGGIEAKRTYGIDYAWYVKKDSI